MPRTSSRLHPHVGLPPTAKPIEAVPQVQQPQPPSKSFRSNIQKAPQRVQPLAQGTMGKKALPVPPTKARSAPLVAPRRPLPKVSVSLSGKKVTGKQTVLGKYIDKLAQVSQGVVELLRQPTNAANVIRPTNNLLLLPACYAQCLNCSTFPNEQEAMKFLLRFGAPPLVLPDLHTTPTSCSAGLVANTSLEL